MYEGLQPNVAGASEVFSTLVYYKAPCTLYFTYTDTLSNHNILSAVYTIRVLAESACSAALRSAEHELQLGSFCSWSWQLLRLLATAVLSVCPIFMCQSTCYQKLY